MKRKSDDLQKKYMSMDDIYEQYYEYVKTHSSSLVDLDTVSNNSYRMPDMFRSFFCQMPKVMPFSLYQKINHHKLSNYVKKRLVTEVEVNIL